MNLTLELTETSGGAPGTASQHVFGEGGGTIGRANTNTWVLPHSKVSGRHAVITFRNGVFYIEDTSLNGVCVNSVDNRLVRNRPYALKSGDHLFIEPYEMGVWIDNDSAAARPYAADPFAQDDPFRASPVSRGSQPLPAPIDPIVPDPALGGEVDPLKFFDPVGGPAPRKRVELPVDDGLGQHYQPPAIISPPQPPPSTPPAPPAAVIPAGYNPLADDPFVDPIAPPPTPAPPIRPRPGDSQILRRKAREGTDSPRKPAGSTPVPPPPSHESSSDILPRPSPAMPPPQKEVEAQARPTAPPPPPRPVVPKPVPADPAGPARAAAAPPLSPIAPPGTALPDDVTFGPPISEPILRPADAAPRSEPPKTAPVPEPAPPAARPGSDLVALLAGAGMPDAVVTPELSRNLGEILRVVVSGLMDVLQSRQRIKEEFRMQQTIFRPADNNPLKFSVNVEDALHNLLVKRNPAYLRPVDAFADAFDDLRDHQLAMLAGMRVAFDAMLAEFDPDRLQQQFDTQLGKSVLIPAKMRYWDLLCARRAEMVKDPEEAFERLFGEEFRRAYEEQFRQLKAQRRGRATSGLHETGPDRS